MNRLVIIGNGFDLAHGMPTSYANFVKWYLVKFFSVNHYSQYIDAGVTITCTEFYYDSKKHIEGVMEDLFSYDDLAACLNNKTSKTYPFTAEFRYPFLKHILLSNAYFTWVDIENEYYKELLSIAKMQDQAGQYQAVDLLNNTMDLIKKKLEEYLTSLPKPEPNVKIQKIISANVKSNEIIGEQNTGYFAPPANTHILSFNYTNHLDEYFSGLSKSVEKFSINYIHGKINDPANPLIFGFGDEMDDHYKILEKIDYNGFLDNIKSFGYFKTDNYHRLIRFIEEQDFEVFLMGHSCGLSDRVMLNMIFEHRNCKSIRIFYYESGERNNYKMLTQQISRHFNQKTQMRVKVVSEQLSEPLAQHI